MQEVPPTLGAVISAGPGPAAPTLPPLHGKRRFPGKRQEKSMSQTKNTDKIMSLITR